MDAPERPTWLRWLARGREDDPRVAHDLELLAAAYGPDGPPPPERSATVAHDVALLAATYGPDAERPAPARPAVGAHLRRYRAFYALAAAVVAVVLLADPVPPPPRDEFAAPAGATNSSPGEQAPTGGAEASPAPPLEGLAPGLPFDPALDVAPSLPAPPLPTVPGPSPPSSGGEGPLTIAASGYASVTGGTPLEQSPPEGGLPVAATGGTTTKLSFLRLEGTAPVLRLQLVTASGAHLNETSAAVKACRITEAWEPQRGIALSDAPAYDGEDCVVANVASDGIWTFDFAGRSDRTGANGFALVPGVAVADTFQVTFAPTAA